MPEHRPSRGRVNRWRGAAFLGGAIFFLGTFVAHAQDVAEAARQEQARKAAEANAPKHVYTEEDLKKDRILTPDDQARVAARKQQHPVLAQESADKQQPAAQATESESLGTTARRYRNEKEKRQAEETRKKNYTPFRYQLAQPAVASPKAGGAAIPEIRPNQAHSDLPSSAFPPLTPRRSPEVSRGGRTRISPFEPRPLTAMPPLPRVSPMSELPAIAAVPQPTLPASGPRAVESTSKTRLRLVVVQTGDSWWRLASRHLGVGNRWAELRALNPGVGGSADLLRVGIAVLVPEGNKVSVDSRPVTKQIQIRVQRGDTLWSLARKHLGRASAWSCLAGLNPEIRDYGRMAVGTLLQLPAAEQATVCADVGVGLKK